MTMFLAHAKAAFGRMQPTLGARISENGCGLFWCQFSGGLAKPHIPCATMNQVERVRVSEVNGDIHFVPVDHGSASEYLLSHSVILA